MRFRVISQFSLDGTNLPNWDEPQNSSLIADSEGKLFVVNTNRVDNKTDDKARIYEIKDLVIDSQTLRVNNFNLTYVDEQIFYSYNSASGSGDFGDFRKGAGLVVGTHGGLNLYSIENANDGINGSVLAGEFVGRSDNSQSECDSQDGVYAIFYRDKNFSGKNVTMSYNDILDDDNDFHNLALYSSTINDNISSAKWCLPTGCQLALYNATDNDDEQIVFSVEALGVHYYEDGDFSDNVFNNSSALDDAISRMTFLNIEQCGLSF